MRNRYRMVVGVVGLAVSVSGCGVKNADEAEMVRELTEACGANETDCEPVPENVAECVAAMLFDHYRAEQDVLNDIARNVNDDLDPAVKDVIEGIVATCQANPGAGTPGGDGVTTTTTLG